MGPRVLAASSGLAPWSMAVDRPPVLPSKIPIENGGQGGLAHLGCLPLLRERGGHPHNYHRGSPDAKNEVFYRVRISKKRSSVGGDIYPVLEIPLVGIIARSDCITTLDDRTSDKVECERNVATATGKEWAADRSEFLAIRKIRCAILHLLLYKRSLNIIFKELERHPPVVEPSIRAAVQ